MNFDTFCSIFDIAIKTDEKIRTWSLNIWKRKDDICHINDISCIAENKIIYLPPIHVGWSEENENISQMFFIESSGRDHLLPRQACAVESALRNSNIPKIIVGKYFLCLESDLFSM